MKLTKLTAAVCALSLGAAFGAQAASPGSAQAASKYSQRGQLVYQIVEKWGPYVEEAHGINMAEWAREMGGSFSKASLDNLQRAADARTFDAMSQNLTPIQGNASPASLGDPAADLVFVPITPCRIFDTRVAGGAIAAGTTRGIDVTAVSSYSFQGGANTNCSGAGAAGSFAAVAINFTSVAPAQSGYFTAFPVGGTQPLAATQVFGAGQILSNYAVVQLDQGSAANEMNIFAERTVHLVGDMVGYFINPQATALECVTTATTDTSVAAGGVANSSAPSCLAGYTQTATNCESSTWQMPFVFFKNGTCSAQNNSGSAATLRSSRTCCRVPGR